MPPTTPYTSPALTALLMQSMFRGQVPGANTPITDSVMTQLIAWTDGVINGLFRGVGYKVPFLTLSGETWPDDQTVLLQIMSASGASAMASGYVPLPAPRMLPGREGGERNVWATMFEGFQRQIKENGFHFRAQFYLGSKAEKWLSEPYGPRTDFYDGYYDPTRYQLLRTFTDEIMGVFADMEDLDLAWDNVYELSLAATA